MFTCSNCSTDTALYDGIHVCDVSEGFAEMRISLCDLFTASNAWAGLVGSWPISRFVLGSASRVVRFLRVFLAVDRQCGCRAVKRKNEVFDREEMGFRSSL